MVVPTGAPQNVIASATSRSVSASWDVIECIERNGFINVYNVVFEDLSGAVVPGKVTNQNFTVSGLTPHTTYTFRVAGINNNGQGPFSDTLTITTDEESKCCCSYWLKEKVRKTLELVSLYS